MAFPPDYPPVSELPRRLTEDQLAQLRQIRDARIRLATMIEHQTFYAYVIEWIGQSMDSYVERIIAQASPCPQAPKRDIKGLGILLGIRKVLGMLLDMFLARAHRRL
jgi:hypothetical protein